MRARVDLPEPEPPTSPTAPPRGTSSDTPSSATVSRRDSSPER